MLASFFEIMIYNLVKVIYIQEMTRGKGCFYILVFKIKPNSFFFSFHLFEYFQNSPYTHSWARFGFSNEHDRGKELRFMKNLSYAGLSVKYFADLINLILITF